MNWIGFYTLLSNELKRVFRIWKQTLLPPIITTILYFLVFGTIIGRNLENIEGVSYIQFLVPGMIMLSVITSSYANVVGSLFGSKFQRNIEELIVAPISNSAIIFGYCIAGVIRGFIIASLLFIIASFFTKIVINHVLLSFLFVLLTGFCFSLCGFFNALFAKSFDDILLIPDFVLTPLIYLGGVFYAIERLPYGLKAISMFNPIYYIIRGFRYSLIGVGGGTTLLAIFVLIGISLILFYVNLVLIRKKVGFRV